jgi:cytochrome c55X
MNLVLHRIGIIAGFSLMFCVAGESSMASQTSQVPPARKAELFRMLKQDCGSCHGMTLNGGLGKALSPEALQGKDEIYLKTIILDGVKGTAMPPWRPLLTEAEAAELARMIKSGEAYEPKK